MKFDLNQVVTIAPSGEQGSVIARAEYVASEPHYLVRYPSADGRVVESWWGESALV
jgi:hypothetical protein